MDWGDGRIKKIDLFFFFDSTIPKYLELLHQTGNILETVLKSDFRAAFVYCEIV